MVVLSIKYPDGDGFIFETSTATRNDELIDSLVAIHNCRLRARVVIDSVRSLALHGPMKKPDEVGIDYVRFFSTSFMFDPIVLYLEHFV
jgi:hypothetical protein